MAAVNLNSLDSYYVKIKGKNTEFVKYLSDWTDKNCKRINKNTILEILTKNKQLIPIVETPGDMPVNGKWVKNLTKSFQTLEKLNLSDASTIQSLEILLMTSKSPLDASILSYVVKVSKKQNTDVSKVFFGNPLNPYSVRLFYFLAERWNEKYPSAPFQSETLISHLWFVNSKIPPSVFTDFFQILPQEFVEVVLDTFSLTIQNTALNKESLIRRLFAQKYVSSFGLPGKILEYSSYLLKTKLPDNDDSKEKYNEYKNTQQQLLKFVNIHFNDPSTIDLVKANETIENLKSELETVNQNLDLAQTNITILEEELFDIKEKKPPDLIVDDLDSKTVLDTLNKQLNLKQTELDVESAKLKAAQVAQTKTQNELDAIKIQLADVQNELKAAQQAKYELQKDSSDKQTELDTVKAQLADVQNELKAAQQAKYELQKDSSDKQTELDTVKAQLANLQNELLAAPKTPPIPQEPSVDQDELDALKLELDALKAKNPEPVGFGKDAQSEKVDEGSVALDGMNLFKGLNIPLTHTHFRTLRHLGINRAQEENIKENLQNFFKTVTRICKPDLDEEQKRLLIHKELEKLRNEFSPYFGIKGFFQWFWDTLRDFFIRERVMNEEEFEQFFQEDRGTLSAPDAERHPDSVSKLVEDDLSLIDDIKFNSSLPTHKTGEVKKFLNTKN